MFMWVIIWGLGSMGNILLCAGTMFGDGSAKVNRLEEILERLRPLHAKLGKPEPGDWLDVHHESGQSFQEYVRSNPPAP